LPNLLEAHDLKKHYDRRGRFGGPGAVVKAVDGVSFAVPQGQTLGIVGESGCGKSTTAKMLLRLEATTSGRILFDGQEVHQTTGRQLRDYRSKVQAVFQDPYSSLNPRMRVQDIVAEPLQATQRLSRNDVAERVARMIAAVGLSSGTAERYPHEFSGGQRQRIAIARSLVLLPKLLILDEPVSALDVSIQAQILNLLQELQNEFGLSYLLISHQLNVVARMCDQVAVMYLGRVVETGPAREVAREPRHPYTQALFSAALSINPAAHGQRIKLHGEPPSPSKPPPGCRFHTRCRLVIERCRTEIPKLEQGGMLLHDAACHLTDRGRIPARDTKNLSPSGRNQLGRVQ
jgi:oligopeptide/dipeptide ABC transporter ATP-binding protein